MGYDAVSVGNFCSYEYVRTCNLIWTISYRLIDVTENYSEDGVCRLFRQTVRAHIFTKLHGVAPEKIIFLIFYKYRHEITNFNLPFAGELPSNDSIRLHATICLDLTLSVGCSVAHSHPSDLAPNNGAHPPCQSAGHAADTWLKSELKNSHVWN